MAIDRLLPSASGLSGTAALTAIGEEITGLWSQAFINLTGIGGTANAITAALAPAPTAGLVDGMKVVFTAGASNTAAVTLAINGGAANPVVSTFGAALVANDLIAGGTYLLVWHPASSSWVMVNQPSGKAIVQAWEYGSSGSAPSGTWTKPTGLIGAGLLLVEAWGAGGGGGTSGGFVTGGGGGSYAARILSLSEVTASVAYGVGAGGAKGATGSAGGNTTFGAYVIGYGGGPGTSGAAGTTWGGTGASVWSAGIAGVFGGTAGTGADLRQGPVSNSDSSGGTGSATSPNAVDGGGGGAPTISGSSLNGGTSIRGGGGGGSASAGLGGTSRFAGAGGNANNNGSWPSGGGGANGNGANGRLRITLIGQVG